MDAHALAGEQLVCSSCHQVIQQTGSYHGFCVDCLLAPLFDFADPSDPRTDGWFDPYEILTHPDGAFIELGRGSMGVTYQALDTTLQFQVALKVIDFRAAGLEGNRERFLRGARAAARLRHPHVATILYYGVRPDGQCFYAMELVEGETLSERVRREGPLPLIDALEVTAQIASALAAAEEFGLIHRDLKPANIMLASGGSINVKVIDFGLAKLVEDKDSINEITHQGFIGTPAYASPEQFSGDKIDRRSDYFSIGSTLFYLLTGNPPGNENRSTEIPRAGLTAVRQELNAGSVPGCVKQLLGSLLSPNPAKRPQNGQELVDSVRKCQRAVGQAKLGKWSWAAAGIFAFVLIATGLGYFWFGVGPKNANAKSIAILPFENLSPMGDKAYFSDGVQDEILTNLAKAADLQVISRGSVQGYRDPAKRPSPAAIGRELHVNYLVNGSVERETDWIRVNVNLIEAKTGREVWAERYDGQLSNLFAIQVQIAKAISQQLQARLSSGEKAAIEDVPTHDLAAYESYLRAKQIIDNYYESTQGWGPLFTAIQLLTDATTRDPNFALAWARLAWADDNLYFFNADHTEARRQAAQAAVDKALHLRPDLGQVHLSAAIHLFANRDYRAVRKELELAQRTLPNSASLLGLLAATQGRQGQWQDAIDNINKALTLDPKNFSLIIIRFDMYQYHRRYDDVRRLYREAADTGMDNVSVDFNRAETAYWETGDTSLYHQLLNGPVAPLRAIGRATLLKVDVGMIDRDFDAARKALADDPANEFEGGERQFACRDFVLGWIKLRQGDKAGAGAAFSSARPEQAKYVEKWPDDANPLMMLAKTDAGLGRKEDALTEARRAVTMRPISEDAVEGPLLVEDLAQVYLLVGERELALKQLEDLTQVPRGLMYGDLAKLPDWDPLRNEPRFQAILKQVQHPIPIANESQRTN
jgi:eukaryotic-like serine/threonine-protein kinase